MAAAVPPDRPPGSGFGGTGTSGTSSPPAPAPPPNQAPVRVAGLEGSTVKAGFPVDVDVTFAGQAYTDPDGDPLSYRVSFRASADPASFWRHAGCRNTPWRACRTVQKFYDIVVRAEDNRGMSADFRFFLTVPARIRRRS